jgi:hypothetical protein
VNALVTGFFHIDFFRAKYSYFALKNPESLPVAIPPE